MTDLIIPLGIPALVTGLIWLLLYQLSGAGRFGRATIAIALPTVALVGLYCFGVRSRVGAEEFAVMAIVVICQWLISGCVVFVLERWLRGQPK